MNILLCVMMMNKTITNKSCAICDRWFHYSRIHQCGVSCVNHQRAKLSLVAWGVCGLCKSLWTAQRSLEHWRMEQEYTLQWMTIDLKESYTHNLHICDIYHIQSSVTPKPYWEVGCNQTSRSPLTHASQIQPLDWSKQEANPVDHTRNWDK